MPAPGHRNFWRSIPTGGCRSSSTTILCCSSRWRSRFTSPRSIPFGKLYPATLEGEARAWQWSFWAIAEVDRGVNIWSLHAVRLPPAERDPALCEEALKVVAGPFKVLDAAVATQPYLLGDDFTVADLNVAAVISRADRHGSLAVAASEKLARALPRPAGGARGVEA